MLVQPAKDTAPRPGGGLNAANTPGRAPPHEPFNRRRRVAGIPPGSSDPPRGRAVAALQGAPASPVREDQAGRWRIIHASPPTDPALLPEVQEAHGAGSGARQEAQGVRAQEGSEALPPRDRGLPRLPASEARGPREGHAARGAAREEVRAQGGGLMARHGQVTKFVKVKCKDCGNEQIVFAK